MKFMTATALVALVAASPVLAQTATEPAEREAAAASEVDGERTVIIVRQPAATVRVFEPAPTVTVTQPAPRIVVRQYDPIVTVTQQEPEVTVRPVEPQVRVELRDPEVSVEQPEPTVAIAQPEAQFELTVPEPTVEVRVGQPLVAVQPMAPEVAVATPEPEVQVTQPTFDVQVEQEQPTVQVEQAQPQVEVERTATVQPDAAQVAVADRPAAARTEGDRIPRDQLIGVTVRNADGDAVGDVEDVLMDRDTRQAVVVISVGGVLGLGETELVFPYTDIDFDGEEAILLTAADEAALENRPEYDEDNYVELPAEMIE
ncbi:PRC-barrel domain-containing protein [Acuticoccus sp.]|uniref:PRC-barrel domain-containing protein n=1 Tax=Acuticoccus sp. TaxID=1904378 RepID=UPI003B520106